MICIIVAMEEEIKYLKSKYNLKEEIIFFDKAIYYNENICVGLSGIGKVNASLLLSYLLNRFNIDKIINIGIGAAFNSLEQSDVLISDKVIYHDFDLTKFGYLKGEIPGICYFETDKSLQDKFLNVLKDENVFVGNIASGDKFVLKKNEIDLPYQIEGIDMESGGIAQTANFYKKPFVIIRVISDCLEKNSKLSYNEFEKICGIKISKIIDLFLKEEFSI